MNTELIKLAKKAADSWRGTDAYRQAATIIDMLIDEIEHGVSVKKEKYYIRDLSADGGATAVVALTDDEYKAVKKFLDAPNVFDDGYGGDCTISDIGYETYEEALEHCH